MFPDKVRHSCREVKAPHQQVDSQIQPSEFIDGGAVACEESWG